MTRSPDRDTVRSAALIHGAAPLLNSGRLVAIQSDGKIVFGGDGGGPITVDRSSASFDAAMCVGPQHAAVASVAARSVLAFAKPRRLLVLTSEQTWEALDPATTRAAGVEFVDEDRVLAPVSLASVRQIFQRRIGNARRAAWYFQQLLKIGVCRLPELTPHCLVWDSDTILLRPTAFIDDDARVLLNPRPDYREPYFQTLERLLGFGRQISTSFILISVTYMQDLLSRDRGQVSGRRSLDRCDPRGGCGRRSRRRRLQRVRNLR